MNIKAICVTLGGNGETTVVPVDVPYNRVHTDTAYACSGVFPNAFESATTSGYWVSLALEILAPAQRLHASLVELRSHIN